MLTVPEATEAGRQERSVARFGEDQLSSSTVPSAGALDHRTGNPGPSERGSPRSPATRFPAATLPPGMDVFDELLWRALAHQWTGEDALPARLKAGPITL